MNITHYHHSGLEKAKTKINDAITTVPGVAVSVVWTSDTDATLTAKVGKRSIHGSLHVDGEKVEVDITLPMFLRAFAGSVEEEIRKRLVEELPDKGV